MSGVSIKPEADVSREKAYIGEPVLLRYYLVCSGIKNIRVDGIEKHPEATGFIITRIDDSITDKNLDPRTQVHLMTYVLTPAEKGSHEIDPGIIIISADTEDGISQMMQQKRVAFPKKIVQVLPLPVSHRPDSFRGAVGNFEISTGKYEPTVKLFEEKKIILKVSGVGNFFALSKPELKKSPDGFKVIVEESDPEYSLDNDTVKGVKTYTAMIIPEKSGDLKPGAFAINFFNPETGGYETCESEELSLDVVDSGTGRERQKIKSETDKGISFSPLIMVFFVIVIALTAFSIFRWEKKRTADIKAVKSTKPVARL